MNIKEVAQRAGVSVATISRVLNHPELVQPETRERVLAVMEKLHYTPNWLARGLNLGKTRTIALLLPDIEHESNRDLFAGVETVVQKKGYATLLYTTRGTAEGESDCLRLVRDRSVDGLLLALPRADLAAVAALGIPYVGVGRSYAGPEENCCYINCEEGTFQMTRHLLSLGHRQITLLLDRNDPEDLRRIASGCRRAVLDWGDGADGRVLSAENSIQGGFVAAERLFQNGPLPEALLCDSAELTFGVLKAAEDRSVSIPDDLALTCLTDSPLCTILSPAITALEQPTRRLGIVAARMLFDLVENEELNDRVPQEIILQPKLKIRRSCGNQAHISELFD